MKGLMRFLLVILLIVAVLYYGGNAYLRKTLNTDIGIQDLMRIKETVQDFIRSQSPQDVKDALARNAKTVQLAIEKGLITARQIDEAQMRLEEMIRNKAPLDKNALAEKYLKGKLSASDYSQVQSILAKGVISLQDWSTLLRVLQKAL